MHSASPPPNRWGSWPPSSARWLNASTPDQEQHGFAADDVARIDVHGSTSLYKHVGWDYRPDSVTAAQMNLQFCIATLLLEGGVTVDHFTPDAVAAPNRLALAKRVKIWEK